MSAAVLITFLLTTAATPAKMPSPADLLEALSESDPPAALRFCAERPALHAAKGESAVDDVDAVCESTITKLFSEALKLPALRELGPFMIRALEKSPVRWFVAKPYAERYRYQVDGVRP